MGNRDKLELKNVCIYGVTRLPNSVNGNPRYRLSFVDNLGATYRNYITSSDAACNYEVQNFASSKCLLDVYVTRAGRASRLVPVK